MASAGPSSSFYSSVPSTSQPAGYSRIEDDPLYPAMLAADEAHYHGTNHNLPPLRKQLIVPVHPRFMGNEDTAIRKFLDDLKGKYVPKLGGYIIDYEDMDYVEDLGHIIDDKPYIYWTIEADFFIFKAKKGEIIEGVISTISYTDTFEQFTCEIFNCVKAKVEVEDEVPEDIETFLRIYGIIPFEVTSVSHANIEGIFTKECMKLLREKKGLPREPTSNENEQEREDHRNLSDPTDEVVKVESDTLPEVRIKEEPL